jgi:hypothetical protein
MILKEKKSWATSSHLRQLLSNFLQVVYNYKETQKVSKGVQYRVHIRANNTCYTSCYYIGQFIRNTKIWKFSRCGGEVFYSLTTMHSFLDMKVNINIGIIWISLNPISTSHTSLVIVLGRVLVLGGQDWFLAGMRQIYPYSENGTKVLVWVGITWGPHSLRDLY